MPFVDVHDDTHELITAPASQVIEYLRIEHEGLGDHFKHFVADSVAIFVIYFTIRAKPSILNDSPCLEAGRRRDAEVNVLSINIGCIEVVADIAVDNSRIGNRRLDFYQRSDSDRRSDTKPYV